jgi:isopentenyl-diphosphate delta-isomerase
MEAEYVVLVDENDKELGTMEKLQAHHEGKLHRAVSVVIFNSQKEMLLQKRASSKYHSAGLWSNACCSHPRPGEKTLEAAKRRLAEEMGIQCDLQEVFNFTYQIQLPGGLSEHEFDHVFAGICNEVPKPNPAEVSDWKFVNVHEIQNQLQKDPQQFTGWFGLIFEHINITK